MTPGICLFIIVYNVGQFIGHLQGSESLENMFFQHVHSFFIYEH